VGADETAPVKEDRLHKERPCRSKNLSSCLKKAPRINHKVVRWWVDETAPMR